jgi:Asp-tRNA(Asn)/Glu-tRNA(Gln) amidotransferase A subunit family amidase
MKWKYFLSGSLSTALILLFAFRTSVFEPLSKSDVDSAARVVGIEFTNAEIDSMFGRLQRYRRNYEDIRELKIDNSLSPALIFNPLPADFEIPDNFEEPHFEIDRNVQLPENMDDLSWYTIPQLAGLLRSGQISSEELTTFYLERLKKLDGQLHFVVTTTDDLAMSQARKADRELRSGVDKGLLHGIPYGAKDLLATKDYRTSWGAMPYRNQVIDMDATVIRKLEDAGAVLVAKMTLGALAMGDVWYGGKTRNPWNPANGSSGSSAGSASAVSAGALPFAIGTETLGSIVSPSTVCGTTGLRPTYGRVSRYGAMALSWSMDKIGPIARSAEDCAIVFDAIAGPDGKDRSCQEAPFNYRSDMDIRDLKVGFLEDAFSRDYRFKTQDSLTLEKLRALGFDLIPIDLPPYPSITFLLTAEAAAAFDELTRSDRDDMLVRQTGNAWPNAFRSARFIPAVEYIQANRLRTRLIEDMHQMFEENEIDIYIHPSWGNASLSITNMTGHPCVVLPNGFRNGTPTSISITGKMYSEAELLAFAKFYQENTDWDEQHPEIE